MREKYKKKAMWQNEVKVSCPWGMEQRVFNIHTLLGTCIEQVIHKDTFSSDAWSSSGK